MQNTKINEEAKEILRSRLKERRLFLNMTYQDLSDKTGISKSTLQRYETGGIQNLSYDKFLILSSALEVEPDYFTHLSSDYHPTVHSDHVSKAGINNILIERFEQREKLMMEFLRKVTPSLIENGYIIQRLARGELGDLIAKKGSEVWYIELFEIGNPTNALARLQTSYQQLLIRLGRVAIHEKAITKFSMALESLDIAEHWIKRVNPTHLDVQISILVLSDIGYKEVYFG